MVGVIITILVLHILPVIQSVHKIRAPPTGSMDTTNFFTDIFSDILYKIFPRNVQSTDRVGQGEIRYLIQRRKQNIKLRNKFKQDIQTMIEIKRNDLEDDRELEYKPPKINYQRKGSKSEALANLFDIAGMSYTSSGSVEEEEEEEESWRCPSPDGYFPAWSCREYFHCSHGVANKMTCSQGLGWNIDTKHCDWIHNLRRCR